ncbi:DUF3159 domain-containing protein [Amorphoplanes digitatis]|uniref:DUF3159 domain-containing protein n=1 Tax=Actinoplanes digitatis TaxID=1868 RepID=A0A7W7MNH3_9ACTN|nr:DUF3159 domain-containing protein [Actinoplanes digitatis]MBB4760535.1 hypothetical protein [Actinoplanes digitatis]BFE68700.1 DUF3159 domain-containing protein [Actinoplanes digitatis]GID97088.1 membrane protein [Actinoplanes digitatis]
MTPGSEPRHVAHESVEERVAEEFVEELELHPVKEEPDEEPFPSMSEQISEQLGGVRGLIESSIPVLAFVLLNVLLGENGLDLGKKTALYWAIGGSLGSAVAIGVYRLARKQSVRHAVNGVLGVAIGAFLAWRTGDAKNFYLPGILLTLGQVVVLIVSVAVRRPIIGYVWGVLANGGKHDWFDNPRLFRTFQWLTLVWAASLFVRAGVQGWLWLADEANAIGVVRILISWPIYAATFAYTAWAVHRVTSATRPADEELEEAKAPQA